MIRIRPKNWWQAGLMWGTAMLVWYLIKDAISGQLTPARLLKDVVVWEAAGVLFGILLALVLSLLSRTNMFRGFPDNQGDR